MTPSRKSLRHRRPFVALLWLAFILTASAVAQAPAPAAVVRDFYGAWSDGRSEDALARLASDVRWAEPKAKGIPFNNVSSGVDGVRDRLLAAVERDFQGFTVALDQVLVNGNQVLVSGSVSGFHRGSGRRLWTPYGAVWTLKDGVGTRVTTFYDTGAFLRAYGE